MYISLVYKKELLKNGYLKTLLITMIISHYLFLYNNGNTNFKALHFSNFVFPFLCK